MHPAPLKLHDTPVLELPDTVAVNCCSAPLITLAVVGDSEMETREAVEPTAIIMDAVAVEIGEEESSTLTVKVEAPAWVGVPEMAPEEEVRASPFGSVPEARLHV